MAGAQKLNVRILWFMVDSGHTRVKTTILFLYVRRTGQADVSILDIDFFGNWNKWSPDASTYNPFASHRSLSKRIKIHKITSEPINVSEIFKPLLCWIWVKLSFHILLFLNKNRWKSFRISLKRRLVETNMYITYVEITSEHINVSEIFKPFLCWMKLSFHILLFLNKNRWKSFHISLKRRLVETNI